MQILAGKSAHRHAMARFIDYLEYLFLFVVIAECNSMYSSALLTDTVTAMPKLFYSLATALAVALIALHALADRRALKRLTGFLPLWLLLVLYAGVFYCLNVRSVNAARRENYIKNFLVLLPLMTLLFKLKQQKGEGLDLLYKHADIVCVVAAMSLLVYLASVFHVNTMPSDPIYSKWGGSGSVRERINLLNVSMLIKGEKWQVSGLELTRNTGFFVEALMFSIPMITALHTELFLRRRADRAHLYRALLLTATLLTANSTIGVMLTAIAWGAKIVSESFRAGKRWIGVLVVCASVAACVAIYFAKKSVKYEMTDISGNSIGDHIEDYKAGIRAFLHRPLLGGGYNYEACIREFMNPVKAARNPGLTNSVATVLGEGGAMLGLMCMAPFAIGLMYVFRKQDRDLAFWMIGPLGLYVGIIFVYHIYLMFVLAFGYSLLETERVEGKGFPWRLSLVDFNLDNASENGVNDAGIAPENLRRKRLRALGLAGAFALAGGLLVWQGVPLFRLIHRFLRTHQFSMSQSPIKALGFTAVLLLHGACIRNALRRELGWKRLVALLAWDAAYLLLIYPRLYSDVATVLAAHHSTGGRLECAALLGVYYVGTLIVLEVPATRKWLSLKGIAAIAAAALCAAGVFLASQTLVNRLALPDEALTSAVRRVTDAATGRVYAGELPSLYRRADGGVALSSTGVSGYEDMENVSIVYPKGQNRWELFEHGFRVAELAEDAVVYSNDERAIAALSDEGLTFYRYYPFGQAADLMDLAYRNGLEPTESGAVVVSEGNSLEIGPSDALQKGQYTVDYDLHVDPKLLKDLAEDAPVCGLVVSGWNGKKDLALKEITAGQFDEDGNGRFSVPFKVTYFCGNAEYRVLGRGEVPAEVRGISLRETPDYITTVGYNCYRNPIREAYYNADGTPYPQNTGYAVLERAYNVGGMVVKQRYCDADGQPMMIKGGYAEIHYGYNSKRTRNYEAYYDTEGKPIRLKAGYAAMKTEYDDYGNAVAVKYFGTDGKAATLPKGYAELRREYDGRKQMTYEACYDGAGNRVYHTDGYSAMRMEYDEDGNVTARRYLDTEDRPVCANAGIAEVRYEYDAIGRAWRESYYGIDGRPAENTSGYAAVEQTLNEAGKKVGETYFDAQGAPTACTSGYAEIRYELNKRGQSERETYYDAAGNPVAHTGGYFGTVKRYDDYGNAAGLTYVDADGEPVPGSSRYASVERTYDGSQNLVGERYFDAQGAVTANKSGVGELRREYNALNQNVRETYRDSEGNPTENSAGVAEIRREYNGQNKVIREEYLDLDGNTVEARGYRAVLKEYNPNYTLAGETYVDENGEPVPGPAGYAHIRYEYDGALNRAAVFYEDGDGNAVENDKGIASIRYEYERRRVVRETYFDAKGEPTASADGYGSIEKAYDGDGNNIQTAYIAPDGSPATNKSGVSIVRREYDAARNCVRETYHDAQGNPTENTSGVAEIRRTYDRNRNKVEEEKLDLAGNGV